MSSKSHWMFIVAAALAATGDYEMDRGQVEEGREMELPARFESGARMTSHGHLHTANDYEVRIDSVQIDPKQLELVVARAQATEQLGHGDLGEYLEMSDGSMALLESNDQDVSITLTGATLQGRVFDGSHQRLPQEGVKISGTLPVEVKIRREKRLDLWHPGKSEVVMEVDFELPSQYFEEVDWQVLVDQEAEEVA